MNLNNKLKQVSLYVLGSIASLSHGIAEVNASEEVFELGTYTVEGFERDYTTDVVESATGLEIAELRIPLTTTVITSDLLDDQQINRVENALRNVAGVQRYKTGNGGEEEFSIRGFDSGENIFKDGIRINSRWNASNVATSETANLERIEVLLGVSSILYGQGMPGGVVNYVSKRPTWDKLNNIELIVGTEDFYRFEGDSTGPIGGSGSNWAYRTVLALEDSGNERDEVSRDRKFIAGSLSWQPGPKTLITLLTEYMDDRYTTDRGQVLDGNNIDGYSYSDRLDPSLFFGIPDWNKRTNVEAFRLNLKLEQEISPTWKLELNGGIAQSDKINYDSSPLFIGSNFETISAQGDSLIQPRFSDGKGETDSLYITNIFDLETEVAGRSIEQKIRLEFSIEKLNTEANTFRGSNNVTYNIFNRTYGGLDFDLIRPGQLIRKSTEKAINLQDLIGISKKTDLLIGIRYSEHTFDAFGATSNQSTKKTTPRIGIIHRPFPSLALYANYAGGYMPSEAVDSSGNILSPESNQQFEIGSKWQSNSGNFVWTTALYEIERQDIAGTDPASQDPTPPSINIGNTRSRGFETQLSGEITKGWRIIAGYTYIDSEITRGVRLNNSDIDPTGNREPGVPKHSLNLWSIYEFKEGALKGLGIGGGLFYSDKVYISRENRATFDAWTQVDAMIYYKKQNWKIQFNVQNLFDKKYNLAQASVPTDWFGAIRAGTSSPLSLSLSMAYSF